MCGQRIYRGVFSTDYVKIYLRSIFFYIDFAWWKSVGYYPTLLISRLLKTNKETCLTLSSPPNPQETNVLLETRTSTVNGFSYIHWNNLNTVFFSDLFVT